MTRISVIYDNGKIESFGNLINIPNKDLVKSLSYNFSSLEIKDDILSKFTNLEELDISDNNIRFLPESVGDLTNLKILKCNHNSLMNTLPNSIGK